MLTMTRLALVTYLANTSSLDYSFLLKVIAPLRIIYLLSNYFNL